MIRELFAARINLATVSDQTHPFESKRLLLMQLFVPLQRQGVGQHRLAVAVIALEGLANEPLLVVENVASHVIRASKRRRTTLDWTGQPLARLDLLASQLVRSQTPISSKDLVATLDGAEETDAGFALSMDLEVVLQTLGRRECLVTVGPRARILDPDQAPLVFQPMARQVLGRPIRGITSGLGTVVR